MHQELLLSIGAIIVLSIGAQWLAWRVKMPSILFLLLFGFVAGPITGLLEPDQILGNNLFPLVSISVGIILFEGGLTLNMSEFPSIGGVMLRLISIGALITWAIAGAGAHLILGLTIPMSILLGAIFIVTGPTVVGPILRQVRPKGKVAALLKWEGILIDPVGAVVAVLVFEAILEGNLLAFDESGMALFLGILRVILEGGGMGVIGALFLIFTLRNYWLPDYLQNGVALMVVISIFALSDSLTPEAGLLATTVMGVVLANQRYVPINRIIEFTEDLQVLLIGVLFILLSARIPLDSLLGVVNIQGALYLVLLIFVARPLSVLITTFFSELTWRERLFTAWMAPRGIVAASVASVFSFELVNHGVADADQLTPITFLVIVGTVITYGLTAGIVGRWLGFSEQNPQGVLIIGADIVARSIGKAIQDQGFRALLVDTNHHQIAIANQQGLETYRGDALTDKTTSDLSFSGLGRIMALTPNNEVNTLSVIHFSDEFSRAETFQLYLGHNAYEGATPSGLHGRFLFSAKLTHSDLTRYLVQGAEIKATLLDDQFDYDTFQEIYEETAFPLFIRTENDMLLMDTIDTPVVPQKQQTLIALYLPESQERRRQYEEGRDLLLAGTIDDVPTLEDAAENKVEDVTAEADGEATQ